MQFSNLRHSLLLAASMLCFSSAVHADMLQLPIQASAGVVPPNVMFTLDDSGSMGFECLPDALCVGSQRVGAFTDSLGDWKNGTATFTDDNNNNNAAARLFNRQLRSSDVNPLFYNPAVRYRPWMKADGTRYPEYAGTSAATFPEGGNGSENLVVTQTVSRNWCTSNSSCATSSQKYYLAQYFNLTGNNKNDPAGYTRVVIQSGNAYPRDAARVDCVASTSSCSYSEELQNFSNWYSYHRSRIRVAIAGTAEAFFSVPDSYRVGYGRINKSNASNIDGLNITTVEKGVRPFNLESTGNKNSFYTWLFAQIPRQGGTPLRRAMDNVGQYYSYTDSRGPWGDTPGTSSSVPPLACRRAFHMLMTDGMWNSDGASTSAAAGNVDNSAGPTITGPNNQTYRYAPVRPYSDNNSGTLADVAMYYWNRDLNPGLANGVTATSANPAFWQHMVNYTISFGVAGTLNPATDLPALANGTKNWPAPSADNVNNIDDLWHAAVNSRGRYLSASNTTEYSGALQSIIDDIAAVNGSEAGVGVSSRVVSQFADTNKYQVEYASSRWSGNLRSVKIDPTTGDDAGELWNAVSALPSPVNRKIFSYDSGATTNKGVVFTWAGMGTRLQTALMGSANVPGGADVVNYLRGDRTLESSSFRARTSALGDIVNSAPIWVKDLENEQYDFLSVPTTGTVRASYRRFLEAKKLRNPQIIVGANDGMLHAFSDVNGAETFAFVPPAVIPNLINLTKIDYSHQYFVDGPLVEADVHDTAATKWRNLVIGSTGAGAKSLFAINVPVVTYSDSAASLPAALDVNSSAPTASDILWSVSNTDSDYAELGYVLQSPEHGFLKNTQSAVTTSMGPGDSDGTWVVIAGNGYESASRKAQLFIINALTGRMIKKIDTGVGSLAQPNGLGGVRVVVNTKKEIVAAYAGDLQGNMWKFDLSSTNPADWDVAFGGASNAARNPLYKTPTAEPITAAPTYTVHPRGGVMILFGTGKLFETGDDSDGSLRALYGVWDRVAVGTASASPTDRIADQSTIVAQALTAQPLTGTEGTFYGLTVTPVDFTSKRGWRLPLTIGAGQRLVDNPEMAGGLAFMQTTTPAVALASCTAANVTRFGFLLDPFMKAITKARFDTNGDNAFGPADQVTAAAVMLVGSGPATMVREAGTDRFRMVQSSGKNPVTQGIGVSTRRYWRQLFSQPQ